MNLEGLGPDELRVLAVLADRLRMGARTYGALDIDGGRRDWRAEAAEEALDLAAYLAAELLRERSSGRKSTPGALQSPPTLTKARPSARRVRNRKAALDL